MAVQSEAKRVSENELHRQGTTHQQEVVILRFCPQVLEDRLLPVPLHVVPVLNLTMPNRIVHAISRGLRVRQGLIADEEIKVFNTPLLI